ncbi:MAG TPA: LysM peptidoglycan-binding domain-containing protein [Caldilineaceae bacterium]|nr:LysM peptidoglycan-binding domain-containing protein [Caldilineaceae bacterium]
MNNRMRSRHLQLSFNVIVLTVVFAMSFAWLPTQAAALSQKSTCQIAVKAGWSPHRVQAEDTLDALAARSGVSVADLMQANCLDSDEVEVGALVLTPKLGPILPTATPTAVPTEEPTAVPTPTKPAIIIVDESSSATVESAPTAEDEAEGAATTANAPTESADVATATPDKVSVDLSTTQTVTEGESAPAVVLVEPTATATATAEEEKAEETPVAATSGGGATPSSFPLGTSGLIGISLFIMGSVSALFFALQPRKTRSVHQLQSEPVRSITPAAGGMVINIVFLIGGFVVGAVLFPMLRMPGFVELPTWLSATAAIGLIVLLAVKEVLLGAVQWRGLNRVLNLGIAPLLMIFVLSVVSRFAGMGQ